MTKRALRLSQAGLGIALSLAAAAVVSGAARASAPANQSELWVNPTGLTSRDLFFGPGGRASVPDPNAAYRFKSEDKTGHSGGYEVVDPSGRKWKIKIGDEVSSEIAVSRILWAIGYHQPVLHYVARFNMTDGPKAAPAPGRFRLESDHKKDGDWSWDDNPFVGTQAFRGLVVVNLLLNNWDMEANNNRIYRPKPPGAGPSRWFVVQDLGGSLAKTKWPVGGRNDIDGYESQGFIKGVSGGQVDFDYHGPHGDLVKTIKPEDVVWACKLLSQLSEKQLLDAFRAAGYSDDVQRRYVRKIRQKIDEGLALAASAGGHK